MGSDSNFYYNIGLLYWQEISFIFTQAHFFINLFESPIFFQYHQNNIQIILSH